MIMPSLSVRSRCPSTLAPPHVTSSSLAKHHHQNIRRDKITFHLRPPDLTSQTPPPTTPAKMSSSTSTPQEATQYLSTFLNRTLHLHTTDGRMFAGQMKCTDPQRNIILSMTHEYRQPSTQDIQLAAQRHEKSGKSGNVKVDMKKRFVGLVVVPGKYITKIEVEE